jgi:hypothetical protein
MEKEYILNGIIIKLCANGQYLLIKDNKELAQLTFDELDDIAYLVAQVYNDHL